MSKGGDTKPPAQESLLLGNTAQTSAAWLAYFEQISLRLNVSEARLLNLERLGLLLVAAGSYANDAAAAAAGVQVGGWYRSGSQLMVRVV